MSQKVYTFIGAVIIGSGLLWYMQMHFKDYAVHQELEKRESSAVVLNQDALEVHGLLENGSDQAAIDKLIKMVEEAPDDLDLKLKLTQVFCNQCVLDTVNCENAMWQINSILKSNPNQKDALLLKEQISSFIGG